MKCRTIAAGKSARIQAALCPSRRVNSGATSAPTNGSDKASNVRAATSIVRARSFAI
ncbi:hypothetical protein D3C86_1796490 [compost metagenome]